MMPELGKYATAVLGSYAATALLLVALIAASLIRSARLRKALRAAEERLKRDG